MRTLPCSWLLLLAIGCASPAAVSTSAASAPARPDPAVAQPALPAETVGPVRYVVDDLEVSRSAFDEALARLVVDERATYGERVENEDGSYGGAAEVFCAVERRTGERYTVTNTITVTPDGRESTTVSIAREPAGSMCRRNRAR